MMLRRKDLEYSWIFKASFWVNAYTATLKNGKTYIVFAHDYNDMEFFLTRLSVKEAGIMTVATDSDFVPYRKKLSYIPDKNDEPVKRPFWYRGRIYELADEEMR